MNRPPLDVIGLFVKAPSGLPPAPAGAMPCSVDLIPRVRDVLDAHLLDLDQPLSLVERGPLARARQGLRVRWDADVPPGERLPFALERMVALCDAGALGIYLPAACKVIGPDALEAALAALERDQTWWALFVHRYVVLADAGLWLHTHGMEHFGYPDLECWVDEAAMRDGEDVLRAGVELLMREGGEALWDGQILEAVADDQAWARCLVRAAHAVDGHAYGAYGALELVLDDAPPPLETPAAAATEGCP